MIRTILDFETAYGAHPGTGEKITLSAMTTEEYVRHPRFRIHGLGVKVGLQPARWLTGEALIAFVKTHPWRESFVVCHHAHFDGAILSWRLGIRPAFWACTLSMGRALFPWSSASLDALTKLLGLPPKGKELANFKDKWTLTEAESAELGSYCCNDVELTAALFDRMLPGYPLEELRLIDTTVRLFTEPLLRLNPDVLCEEIQAEQARKAELLAQTAADRSILMSNDKLAAFLAACGVEPPVKTSLRTGKQTWAFSKSDEEFKRLLDHDDPAVGALVAARLGVKSTINETRAERMLGISGRGAWPVYLSYCAASTFRFGGGDKLNPQNLSRGSRLRTCIEAPPGHALIVADLSQIEARILAVLAGQENLVEQFARGEDVYCKMASRIFGVEVTKADKDRRFLGKAVTLGCLGPDTRVLTDSGWKPIVLVKGTDMLWDGAEWVTHSGVINQGEKECLTAHGITATPDHEMLTEHGWLEWQKVLTHPSLIQSAVRLANLPFSNGGAGSSGMAERQEPRPTSQLLNVLAGGLGLLTAITLRLGELHDAIDALKRKVATHAKNIGGMKTFFRTMPTENDCLTAYLAAYPVAIPHTAKRSIIMGEGGYSLRKNGEQELRGEGSFFPIYSPSLGGTDQNLISIESMLIEGMSQAICGLFPKQTTQETKERLQPCKTKSMTYDIAFAGPRNRFTIATTAGPIIAHNCGYGLGWGKFQAMIRIGMLGNAGFLFGRDIADVLGLSLDRFTAQNYQKAMELKPLHLDDETHLLHCACAKEIIDRYRMANNAITTLWKQGQAVIPSLAGAAPPALIGVEPTLEAREGEIRMPNGLGMKYHKVRQGEDGREWSVEKRRGRSTEKTKLYGGLIVENCTQSLARIVITEAMNRMTAAGVRLVLQVHDEVVACAPERDAAAVFDTMQAILALPPAWMPSLPLASEGGWARNYSK